MKMKMEVVTKDLNIRNCVVCKCGTCTQRVHCDWGCDRYCGGRSEMPPKGWCDYYQPEKRVFVVVVEADSWRNHYTRQVVYSIVASSKEEATKIAYRHYEESYGYYFDDDGSEGFIVEAIREIGFPDEDTPTITVIHSVWT